MKQHKSSTVEEIEEFKNLIVEINHFRINHEEYNRQISSDQWDEFWKVIDEIDAWRGGKDYFNQEVLDGTQWELVIYRKG